MKFSILKSNIPNTRNFFRTIGYFSIPSSQAGKASFIHRIHQTDFPRFHMYISQNQTHYNFDLHMDLLRPQHKITARASENTTQPVQDEMNRIIHAAETPQF